MDYSKRWVFEDVGKGAEEAYFRQKEAELIETLRRRFQEQRAREQLGDAVEVHDETILKAFEALGFSRDTVSILHLVPLIQVAWSDGDVSDAERAKIREVAALRGVAAGTPGYGLLERLLDKRPSDQAFDICWRVIRATLAAGTEEKRAAFETDLPSYATQVAKVSGGLLGFHAISASERKALERVAQEIAETHADAARTVIMNATQAGRA
jgi:hypothetical protein